MMNSKLSAVRKRQLEAPGALAKALAGIEKARIASRKRSKDNRIEAAIRMVRRRREIREMQS